jgi:hypothetical protein
MVMTPRLFSHHRGMVSEEDGLERMEYDPFDSGVSADRAGKAFAGNPREIKVQRI